MRLKHFDYASAGAYFVTIVLEGRMPLFGNVVDGEMQLDPAGEMVRRLWESMPERSTTISMDEFIIMPNHIHGIVFIYDTTAGAPLVGVPPSAHAATHSATGEHPTTVGAPLVGALAPTTGVVNSTLGLVIGTFKSLTTLQYANGVKRENWPPFNRRLWQRNYYEHVVRGERQLNDIRQYIKDNPLAWDLDEENPSVGWQSRSTPQR